MKCNTAISYNEIMESGGIILRRCPITNGVETRMTEAGFQAICTATRKRTNVFSFSGNSTKQTVAKKSFCAECRGKIRPAELIIITLEEGEMTTIKKGPGECAICGRNTTVFTNHDTLTCSNCAAVQAAITKRPGSVAEIITQLGKTSEIVGMLGGQIGAAESVSNDNGLAAELMEHILERYNLESTTLIPSFVDNLDHEAGDNKRRAHAAETVIKDIRSMLELQAEESIIEKIFELRREYDFTRDDLKCAEQVIEMIHEKIGKGKGETVLDAVERLQRDRQQARDILFEVCGILNLSTTEMFGLPTLVRDLSQALKNTLAAVDGAEQPIDELPEQPKPEAKTKTKNDTKDLLETAIDCLKGWPISQERMAWLIEEAFEGARK